MTRDKQSNQINRKQHDVGDGRNRQSDPSAWSHRRDHGAQSHPVDHGAQSHPVDHGAQSHPVDHGAQSRLSTEEISQMLVGIDKAHRMRKASQMDPYRIYINEVRGRQRRIRMFLDFTHSSTKAAAVMLLAAIAALVIANTPAREPFAEFWHTYVVVTVGDAVGKMSLTHIINDIFMAIFFLLVGLEIKYEMTVGQLTNIRQAALPIIGAFGGVIMPVAVYLIVNVGVFEGAGTEAIRGWGVPTATDIAFALGILALLGERVPSGARVFLSTLAVADDIIAILVIAVFYGQSPSFAWLACAAVVFLALICMSRAHVYALAPYVLVGCVLWLCLYLSGVHSTIAGVLLAFAIPSGSRVDLRNFFTWSDERIREAHSSYDAGMPVIKQGDYIETMDSLSSIVRQAIPPAVRLERKLHPWVYFCVLPLFALTNADVTLAGGNVGSMIGSPVALGVLFGLALGKPIGIMLFSFLTIRANIATLPEHVTWLHMVGVSVLGGVGFTMAIFVANLAFVDAVMVSEAKLGILVASLASGVIGFLVLLVQARLAERRGAARLASREEGEGEEEDAPAVDGEGSSEGMPNAASPAVDGEGALEGALAAADEEAPALRTKGS